MPTVTSKETHYYTFGEPCCNRQAPCPSHLKQKSKEQYDQLLKEQKAKEHLAAVQKMKAAMASAKLPTYAPMPGDCASCGIPLLGCQVCCCGQVASYAAVPDIPPPGKCANCNKPWAAHQGWKCVPPYGGKVHVWRFLPAGDSFYASSKAQKGESTVKLKALSIEVDTKQLSFDLMRQLTDEFLAKNPKEAKKWWDVMAVVRGPDVGLNGVLAKIDGSTPEAEKERVQRKRQTCSILRGMFFPQAVNCSSADITTDPNAKIMLPPKEQWDHYDKHVWKVCQAHGISYKVIGQPEEPPEPQLKKPTAGFKAKYGLSGGGISISSSTAGASSASKMGSWTEVLNGVEKANYPPSLIDALKKEYTQWPFQVELVNPQKSPGEPGDVLEAMGDSANDSVVVHNLNTDVHFLVYAHGAPMVPSSYWVIANWNGGNNLTLYAKLSGLPTSPTPTSAEGEPIYEQGKEGGPVGHGQ